MTVSADDIRRLLAADHDSVLTLVEGRTQVLSPAQLSDDSNLGALEIVTHSALLERMGTEEPSDHDIDEQAGLLDATISELGG